MRVRPLSAALMTALLLAGCSSGSKPLNQQPPVPPPSMGETAAPTTPQPAPPASSQPVADKSDTTWPPKTASGGIKRVMLKSGEVIREPGLYFLNVNTGQVEGWQAVAPNPEFPLVLTTSADHRWVVGNSQEATYFASRESGAVYRWDSDHLVLSEAGSGLLLFEEASDSRRTGWLRITDENLKPLSRFNLPIAPGSNPGTWAIFAPDGKTVAITWADGRDLLYLVDVATGAATALSAPPDLKDGAFVGLDLENSSGKHGLDVSYVFQFVEAGGRLTEHTVLRRYSWRGEPISDTVVKGRVVGSSPDGQLVAWQHRVVGAVDATVVQQMASDKPLFRVLGAGALGWFADAGAVLLKSETGYHTVSRSGDLRNASAPPSSQDYFYLGQPQPSPTDPDLFAAGPVVYSGAGTVRHAATLHKLGGWLVDASSWSPSGQEVSFTVSPPDIHPYDLGYRLGLPLKVQRPPFPNDYPLQVTTPAADCVNLRDHIDPPGQVIRCLPNGTKLTAGDLSQLGKLVVSSVDHVGTEPWMWVRTEKGEQGWVAVSTSSLDWAD